MSSKSLNNVSRSLCCADDVLPHCIAALMALVWMMTVVVALFAQMVGYVHLLLNYWCTQ